MGDCIDLTLDSDEEAAPQTSRQAPTKRRLPSPPSDDSDVILVEDGAEAKRARQEPAEQQEPVDPDAEVVVTAETGHVALRDFPHSRPDCGTKPFKKGVEASNSITCTNCYCMVCDKSAAECQFWGTGVRARDHCNAHSTSYWEALRKAAKKNNTALLEREYGSSAPQLHTGWLDQPNGTAGSKRSSTAGMVSPAVLWACRANAAVASSQALLRTPAGPTPAAAAAAARSSVPAAAVGGLGGSASPLGTPAAAMKSEPKAQTPATQTPQLPAVSSWMQRMPHPDSVVPQMQHLATLELPVKAVKGLTIAEVQRRLVPTGFYKGMSGRTPEFGEHLCLDNITGARYVPSKRKEKADFLQLLPLVPPGGLPAAPSTQRTWKLLVIAHDGSARPQAVAVTVEHNCKLSELTSALRSKLGQSNIKPSEELLVAQHSEIIDSWRWLRESADLRMTDNLLRKEERITYYAFKVPKELLALNVSAPHQMYQQHKTRMALVWHEKTLPREDEEQQQQQQQQEQQQRQQERQRQAADLRELHRAAAGRFYPDSDDDSCDYGSGDDPYMDEDMELYVERMMGGCGRPSSSTYRRPPVGVRFGLPRLVVIPELHLHGGDAADKAVRKSVISQLNQFCPPGEEPSATAWPFELNRMSVKTHWQRSQEEDMRWAHRSMAELYSGWDSHGIATLYAHWGVDPIAPPPGFDLEAFTAVPQLTDAADVQQVAGLPKVLQEWADYQTEMKLLSGLPSQVMTELKAACNASPPATDERDMQARAPKPAAAAVLSIIPVNPNSSSTAASSSSAAAAAASGASSSAVASAADALAAMQGKRRKEHSSSRLGILRIEVYVWKAPGRGHRLVAEDANDWGVELTGRQARRRANYTTSCVLKTVMDARLLQEPNGYQLLRELEKLKQTDCRSIAKLMEWVVTGEREPAQQPAGLNVPLHPYQLQSLAFMQEAEKLEGGFRQLLWRWLPSQGSAAQQQQQQQASSSVGVRGQGMWWSPVLDRLSFSVPPAPWGGFLAEEMGLGKTVEVLGLVLSNPAPPSVLAGTYDATGKIISRATLVVVAVSLVGQWCAEASSKLSGGLKMYPYHGSNRVRDPSRLATQYDLVVTTYATLASDYGKNGGGTRNPLHQVKWHRVVFDEGHTVKNAAAAQSKACVAVAAERRWVCTGTPLNNDISDLLGQFAVLGMQPLGSKPFFDSRIKPAFTGHGYGVSLVPLLYTLRHSMVRHTKTQTIAGVSVLALPEKTEELVEVVLSPPERRAYLEVHAKAAALWVSVRNLSPAGINQKLLQIMALLLPLRRICSGGQLRSNDLALPSALEAAAGIFHAAGGAAAAAAAAAGIGVPGGMHAAAGVAVPEDCTIAVPEELECPICLDAFETPVMTPCHHWFCKECILSVLSSNAHCPLCRGDLNPLALRAPGKNNQSTPVLAKKSKSRTRRSSSDGGDSDSEDELEAVQLPDSAEEAGMRTRSGVRPAADTSVLECESKLQALIRELAAMRAADPSSKALVFSQYNSTLEWLQRRLPEEGFSFRTITGSMAQRQRARAIEAFQSDPPTTVFLLSMRSGAVGINLTAASHVFLLEPCLNPALEEQAIGRAWRMGQQRKVTVKRFYVKGSIEERIMDVRRIRQGHAAPAAAAAAAADQAGSSAAAAAAAAAAAGAATPATPAAAAAADDDMDDPITARNKQKVGAAVLAGNLKADRQVLKIAELDLLFRTPELDGHNGDGGSRAAAAAAGEGTSAAAAAAGAGTSAAAAAAGAGTSAAAAAAMPEEAAAAAPAAAAAVPEEAAAAAAADDVRDMEQ